LFAGGPPAARHLAAASRAFHHAVFECWEDLARWYPSRLYVVAGIDEAYRIIDAVERYDPMLGFWERLPPLSSPRSGASAATLAGRLYVLGGEACGRALRDAQRFDPWTNTWEQLPPMTTGRIRAATCIWDGYLYVIGGLDGARPLKAVERYDPRSRKWELLAPMQLARYACAATVLDGFLYAFGGGLAGTGSAATVERFSLDSGFWELMQSVRGPCCGASVAISSGAVFTLGGLGLSGQALAIAEQLNLDQLVSSRPGVVAWKPLPPMPTARHLATTASFQNCIAVVGGKGATFDAVRNVEVFDPDMWLWQKLPSLPKPRLRAAVAGGHL